MLSGIESTRVPCPPSGHGARRVLSSRLLWLLAALPATSTGCGQTCQGVGCASEFGASFVGIHITDRLDPSRERNPRRQDAAIVGEREHGIDWSVTVFNKRVVVGMPGPGAVRAYQVEAGVRQPATDDVGGWESDLTGDGLGDSVVPAGDLDGDGLTDLLITAPTRTIGDLGREAGAVFIVSEGFFDDSGVLTDHPDLRRITGPQTGAHLGDSVAVCPDLDGDGLPELLVSMPWYDLLRADGRTVRTPLAGGVTLLHSADLPGQGSGVSAGVEGALLWTGATVGARAGTSIACTDLIGDDTADIIIGAPFTDGDHEAEGAVYIIDGTSTLEGDLSLVADRTFRGPLDNAWLGWDITTGDLDGDGQNELIAGVPGYARLAGANQDRPEGQVWVWDGQDLRDGVHESPRFRITGRTDGESLGRTVSVQDADGDDSPDMLLGAPRLEYDGAFDAGALYIFRGRPGHDGLRPQLTVRDADIVWRASRQYLETGGTLGVGDADGDGVGDLLLIHRRQPG